MTTMDETRDGVIFRRRFSNDNSITIIVNFIPTTRPNNSYFPYILYAHTRTHTHTQVSHYIGNKLYRTYLGRLIAERTDRWAATYYLTTEYVCENNDCSPFSLIEPRHDLTVHSEMTCRYCKNELPLTL